MLLHRKSEFQFLLNTVMSITSMQLHSIQNQSILDVFKMLRVILNGTD